MEFGDIIGLIGALGKAGTAGAGLLQPQRDPTGVREALQAAADARAYSGWAADPTSQAFKNIQGSYSLENRRSLIDAIQEIIRANNLSAAKGILPAAVNPERRDETVYRTLTKGFMDAESTARDQARNFLMQAAAANQGSGAFYANIAKTTGETQKTNIANRASGQNLLFDALNQVTKVGTKAFGQKSVPDQYRNSPLTTTGGFQEPQSDFWNVWS